MCKYASFVLTKDRVFWSKKTESHEEIIREHQLCECDSSKTRINILRVEISPVKVFSDLSKWAYKVDQDRRPEWFEEKDCEARTREALKKKVDKKLLSAFKGVDEFIASISKVKFFEQKSSPIKSWKIFYGKTRDAARAAAGAAARDAAGATAGATAGAAVWDAARAAAWDAAWDAARAAAWAAVWDAARAAAWDAAWDAARAAAWAAVWDAARAAAGDAGLMARITLCKGLKLDAKHIRHAKARWDVWKRGYGLYCDVNGELYVYGVQK